MNTQRIAKSIVRQDPAHPEFVQNPYALYRRLHSMNAPVFWEDYGFWCLADFASVNSVLRDRRFARLPPAGYASTPLAEHLSDFAAAEKYSLLSLEPPDHTRLRKRVNKAFVSRQVEQMAPAIETLAHQLIDTLESHQHVDLHKHGELLTQYAAIIPVRVITQLLGVPDTCGEQLIAWSHAMVKVYTLKQSHEEELQANAAASEFRAFLHGVIREKRQQPGNDLLSQLVIEDTERDPLNDEEIISIAILLLNAGHEATVHQLGNAIRTLLVQYPADEASVDEAPGNEVASRKMLLGLLAETHSADALVVECLRFDAPLHLFMRYAQEPIELERGPTLQPGDQLGLLLAAANHCPKRFDRAERFLPQRSDAGHLSLGAGIHFCIGAALAKLELRIALQVLFKRLPGLALDGTPEYLDAYHFHGLQDLPVRW